MANINPDTDLDDILFGSIELSKATWLVGLQMTDIEQPSLYRLKGGDIDALVDRLELAQEQHQKRTGRKLHIVVCYEAGYDGFWLHRVLEECGISCHVLDAASIEVNRRRRRPKTDRIDAAKLVRVLMTWYNFTIPQSDAVSARMRNPNPLVRPKNPSVPTCGNATPPRAAAVKAGRTAAAAGLALTVGSTVADWKKSDSEIVAEKSLFPY